MLKIKVDVRLGTHSFHQPVGNHLLNIHCLKSCSWAMKQMDIVLPSTCFCSGQEYKTYSDEGTKLSNALVRDR